MSNNKPEIPRGYNTWYNNSVLTHVLLPEGFALSLGFYYEPLVEYPAPLGRTI